MRSPTVTANEGWDILHANTHYALPVLPTVDEAVVWANELIAEIDAARVAPSIP